MLSRLLLAIVLATAAVPGPASADPLGAGCPSGALMSSIACRVGSLASWAQGSGPPPAVAKKIGKPLLQANKVVMSANRLIGKHKYKPARTKLGKANRNLSKVANILGASSALQTRAIIPTATVAEAAAFCRNIQTDVATVQTVLVPGAPVVIGEICCVQICIPTETDPTPCAIVDAIPCTTPDCFITAACGTNVCAVPTPLGITCAQLLAGVCQGSATCEAYDFTCVPP